MLAKDLKVGDKIYIVRNAIMNVYEVKDVLDCGYHSEILLDPIIDDKFDRTFPAFLVRRNDRDIEYENEMNVTTTSLEKALSYLQTQINIQESIK